MIISDSTTTVYDKSHRSENSGMKVTLSLLNVLEEVNADDSKASKLQELVLTRLDDLSEARPADKFLSGDLPTNDDTRYIQNQIFRYLQTKDKYAALASMLLKSQAFHKRITTTSDNVQQNRIVVDLPRTEHKKPYIPIPQPLLLLQLEQARSFSISVSHQHPFVGIAELHDNTNDYHSQSHSQSQSTLVGMDIVVYDEYNQRLYSNEDEFLEVFQDYFTDREWSLIQSQSPHRLEEFYIRWAMKEAYTKALGVGLGANFASMDLLLQRDVEYETSDGGIFTSMSKHGNKVYLQCGTVEYLKEKNKVKEDWDFAFLPLFGDPPSTTGTSTGTALPVGCACICVGPLVSPSLKASLDVRVDWTNLASLIAWHRC